MIRGHRSLEKFPLLQAATLGDDTGVRHALESGADINMADCSGRTALTCAIAGVSWKTIDALNASFLTESRLNALTTIVSHPSISLYTLNAPQESLNDVTPLGMAAWLNMLEAVKILLESSAGTVAVDGMDIHGATPLMYATRDGSFPIVQQLLAHGARPDMRDMNHHTAIQHALPHPRVLWSCEHFLRQHRWSEFEDGNKRNLCLPAELPISKLSPYAAISYSPDFPSSNAFSVEETIQFTDSLVQAIVTTDIPVLYSLLFPPLSLSTTPKTNYGPVLVNLPDIEGWSAIHYCVSVQPSIEVLDALYRAGADVSLFTVANQWTPLHCLARTARTTDDYPHTASSLYQFVVHLIHDLRAPLSARDQNGETCIHIAAEFGECIEVLAALIDCDVTGSIRNIRNSRGLTPSEVAKPCFRSVFGLDGELARPQSSLSVRTIRPATSLTSIPSIPEWVPPPPTAPCTPPSPVFDVDIMSSSQLLLEHLRMTSVGLQYFKRPAEFDDLQATLMDTARIGSRVVSHFRAQTEEAAKELRGMREAFKQVDGLWNHVSQDLEDQLQRHPDAAKLQLLGRNRRPTRGSEDSQATAVSIEGEVCTDKPKTQSQVNLDSQCTSPSYKDVSVSTEPPPRQMIEIKHQVTGLRTVPWPEWLDSFILNADSSTYKAHLDNLLEIEEQLYPRDAPHAEEVPSANSHKEHKIKNLLKGWKKQVTPAEIIEKGNPKVDKSGASKLKTWMKKKVTTESPLNLELVYDLDDPQCAVAGEVKKNPPVTDDTQPLQATSPSQKPTLPENSLRSCHGTLMSASRDLSSIDEHLNMVDHYISTACHSISRAERIIKRALKTRETNLEQLRVRPTENYEDIFAFTSVVFDSEFAGLPGHYGSSSSSSSPARSTTSSASSSARSSNVSLASTLDSEETEDIRALRRLLLRKIDARVGGAFDEIDRASTWLRVVREVLRDIKKRTPL